MLRTAEQISDLIGIDTQAVSEYLASHKIRASREEGQDKLYDESTQAYLRTVIFAKPTHKETEQ